MCNKSSAQPGELKRSSRLRHAMKALYPPLQRKRAQRIKSSRRRHKRKWKQTAAANRDSLFTPLSQFSYLTLLTLILYLWIVISLIIIAHKYECNALHPRKRKCTSFHSIKYNPNATLNAAGNLLGIQCIFWCDVWSSNFFIQVRNKVFYRLEISFL